MLLLQIVLLDVLVLPEYADDAEMVDEMRCSGIHICMYSCIHHTCVYVNADAHESCTVLCGLLLFPQNMLRGLTF